MPRYEVQTYTLCGGWVNCWTTYEVNDNTSRPTTFATEQEAHVAVLEFFAEEREELSSEDRSEDELSGPEDYRVCEVNEDASMDPEQLAFKAEQAAFEALERQQENVVS